MASTSSTCRFKSHLGKIITRTKLSLSEKLKTKDYEPAKIFNIESVTGEVSDAANMEEQRKRVEKRRQLAPAKLKEDTRDMADLERVKRGEKWHDEVFKIYTFL